MFNIKRVEEMVFVISKAAKQLLSKNSNIIIAIDGRCASGKTTLSKFLENEMHCEVVHMDDFFLRPDQRTKDRFLVPGANVDHERFQKEVIEPLKKGIDFSYYPFDCKTQSMGKPIFIKQNPITIVEGSYSCHPELWESYDLHVFMDIDTKTQHERILLRNTAPQVEAFFNKWIPLEEEYFSAYKIKEKCEITND